MTLEVAPGPRASAPLTRSFWKARMVKKGAMVLSLNRSTQSAIASGSIRVGSVVENFSAMNFSKLRIGPLIPALSELVSTRYLVKKGPYLLVHQNVELPVCLLNELCCTFNCILVDDVELQSVKGLEDCGTVYRCGVRDEGSCYCARRCYGILENLEAPPSDVDFGAAVGERLRDHQATGIH